MKLLLSFLLISNFCLCQTNSKKDTVLNPSSIFKKPTRPFFTKLIDDELISTDLGYTNIDGNSFFHSGLKYHFGGFEGINNILGVNFLIGSVQEEFAFIPELNYSLNINDFGSGRFTSGIALLYLKTNLSPTNINPALGISLFNILEANIGHSFKYRTTSINYEGFRFNINLTIPLHVFSY